MTDQAIFLIIGLMAVIFFLSRARQAKTKGGKFIINDSASPLLGFTPVEPADRSEEEQLLEEQLGGQAFSRGRIRNYPATLLYDSNSGPRRKRHSGMDTARVTLVLSLPTPAPLSIKPPASSPNATSRKARGRSSVSFSRILRIGETRPPLPTTKRSRPNSGRPRMPSNNGCVPSGRGFNSASARSSGNLSGK